MKISGLIFLLLIPFFSNYCGPCSNRIGKAGYQEIYDIPYEDIAEREKKLLSYSVEDQIDIYLFTRECSGDTRVSQLFSETGTDKISAITARIAGSHDEKDKMNLIWWLMVMDGTCRCLKNDPETIKNLENSQSTINESDSPVVKNAKDAYRQALEVLKTERK